MRNIFIRLFVLNHFGTIFGQTRNWSRLATCVVPIVCLCGLWSIHTDANFLNPIGILLLTILFLQNFIGLVYFRYYPVRYKELELSQKWQYSQAFFQNKLTKQLPKSEVNLIVSNWDEINKEFVEKIESKRFYNVTILLIAPMFMIISAIIAINM